MIPILSCAQMRAYDAHAIERCHVAGVLLMENAGLGAAEIAAEMLGGDPDGSVVVVCGRGNNGGDGFVLARHLMARGLFVEVFVLAPRDRIAGDAAINLSALLGLGGEVAFVDDDLTELQDALAGAALAVDAVFGTGLSRAPEGAYARAIALLDAALCPVLALDIPSGVDGDTGAVLGAAVRAARTATFGHLKTGLVQGAGAALAGDIEIVGLGIPDGVILEAVGWTASAVDEDDVADALGRRATDTHKYRAGSVLVVAGSPGKTGAAVLAAEAALRAGAGMATIGCWPEVADAIDARVREVMTARLDPADLAASIEAALERRAAVAIGPGLGLDPRARQVVDAVALRWSGPVVIDADAISHFADRAAELKTAAGPRVLTPHSGELARLLGSRSADIDADRIAAARRAADLTGAVVVLKGPNTVIAGPEATEICLAGNPVLASAGTGDVLTGITAAMLCRTPAAIDAHDAAAAAVYLHARAADRWAARTGSDRGLVASDLAAELPGVIADLR